MVGVISTFKCFIVYCSNSSILNGVYVHLCVCLSFHLSVCHYIGQLLISPQLFVRFDFQRCQMKGINKPAWMVPITLASSAPLVVKIDIRKFPRYMTCLLENHVKIWIFHLHNYMSDMTFQGAKWSILVNQFQNVPKTLKSLSPWWKKLVPNKLFSVSET